VAGGGFLPTGFLIKSCVRNALVLLGLRLWVVFILAHGRANKRGIGRTSGAPAGKMGGGFLPFFTGWPPRALCKPADRSTLLFLASILRLDSFLPVTGWHSFCEFARHFHFTL
jgi:hypothetical protein